MSARLFLSTWSLVGSNITNPIEEYFLNRTLDNLGVNTYVGDANTDGTPGFGLVAVLVRAPGIPSSQIELLGNLQGVHLVPAIRPSYPLTNFSAAIRNTITTFLTNNGFDVSSLNAQSTYGDLILLLASQISPKTKHPGLIQLVRSIESEFD